jgi:peptidoglycan/LPS O-acetylase OafA/YrhL
MDEAAGTQGMTDRSTADGARTDPVRPAAHRPPSGPDGTPQVASGRGRNTGLDGLRVVAAFAVLMTHVGSQTGFEFTGRPASWVADRGDVGVPIFFALSGLLLYQPWARAALDGEAGPRVGSYLLRRGLRILPAYWLVVIIALLTLNRAHIGSASTWAQYLLLIQNYNPHTWWPGTGAPGLAQMWSLVVEVSFYAVLPLLAALLDWLAWRGTTSVARRARRLLAGVAVLGLASYAFAVLMYYPTEELWLGVTLPRLMTWFAAGMAMAIAAEWARTERADGPARQLCRAVAGSAWACWLIAAAAFAIACTPVAGPEGFVPPTLWNVEVKALLYTVVAAALVAPVAFQPASPTPVFRLLGNPVMSFLGRISYGIFLWQFVVIYGFFRVIHASTNISHLFPWPIVVGILLACGVATVAVATASYYLIEQPAQHLYRRLRPARPRPVAGQQGGVDRGDPKANPAPAA